MLKFPKTWMRCWPFLFLIVLLLFFSLQEYFPVTAASQPSGDRVIAESYVVIVQTVTTEKEGLAALSVGEISDPILAQTDSFSGLKQGYYVIIESIHSTRKAALLRCQELKTKGIDCYVRYTGKHIGTKIPTLEEARQIARSRYPKNATTDLAVAINARGRSFPLIILSSPVQKRVHSYTPYEKDYVTHVLIFLGFEPMEIRNHDFLKSGDDIWEEIGCRKIKYLPLSNSRPVPTTIAQNCWYEGESLFRYMIFDDTNLHNPATGTAVWSYSAYPDASHQAFVPNDDPDIPPGISDHRGDGKTVLEGMEGKMVSAKESDGFLVRTFKAVWEKGQLLYHYGPWEKWE
ncbi:hypothetical protein HYR99_20320 [Candidatus Poribacteria bacterium]|nr:hypothetical protein [Candidatus Poribacteria bacterium]